MLLKNFIFLDFSLDHKSILILKQGKLYTKKISSLKRSENISNIFFNFIKKNRIKIDKTFGFFVNLGPGNLISIRNTIVFAKMIVMFFGCKLLGFSNYQILKLNNIKAEKALLTLGRKNLLLDLSKKEVIILSVHEAQKFQSFKFKTIYNKKILKNLILSKNHIKKVVPISYSNV